MKTYIVTAIKRVCIAFEAKSKKEAVEQFRAVEECEDVGFIGGPLIIESVEKVKKNK